MSFFSYSKNFQGVAEVFLRDPERYALSSSSWRR